MSAGHERPWAAGLPPSELIRAVRRSMASSQPLRRTLELNRQCPRHAPHRLWVGAHLEASVMNVFVAEWRPLGVPTPAGAALTNETFPKKLGAAPRTVAKWYASQAMCLTLEMQQALDGQHRGREAARTRTGTGAPDPTHRPADRPRLRVQAHDRKPHGPPSRVRRVARPRHGAVPVACWRTGRCRRMRPPLGPTSPKLTSRPGPRPHGAPGRTRPIRRSRLLYFVINAGLNRDTSAGVF